MKKLGLLPRVLIAICLGLLLGKIMPAWAVRCFVTFNGIFSELLGFSIPLIILGLVAPGIADLGKQAGRLLLITVAIAYSSTLFFGFTTYFTCESLFPGMIGESSGASFVDNPETSLLTPFFQVPIPPVFGVMTALILAFVLGIGSTAVQGNAIRSVLVEFRTIIENLISKVIIPLLPIYIFGIFLNMMFSGAAFQIIAVFGKIIGVIIGLHVALLLLLFVVAGITAKKNPIKSLINMLPAYATALGTSSSAATIPVTLRQVKKMGVKEDIADFCVPLCATIHLPGSVLKIVATSLAICVMVGLPHDLPLYTGFIFMISIVMVAAPGVPGGAIMAALGVIQSMLHFDDATIGLMIAIYIAIDSFGTACNVTGDGAIALILNKIAKTNA